MEDPFQGQAELDVWILFGKRTKKWEKRKKSMEVQMEDKKGSREVDSVASLLNRVAYLRSPRPRSSESGLMYHQVLCVLYLLVCSPSNEKIAALARYNRRLSQPISCPLNTGMENTTARSEQTEMIGSERRAKNQRNVLARVLRNRYDLK